MNLHQLKFYLDIAQICFIVVMFTYFLPLFAILKGSISPINYPILLFHAYTLVNYNEVFHYLWEKWFNKGRDD